MAILPIGKVVPDTDILADQFNQMVDAIQDKIGGHEHNGADYHGKPVDHVWLIDGGTHDHAGSGLNNTLDWHMDAVEGSADHALHGLTSDYHVAGSHAQQLVFVSLHHQFTEAERVGHHCAAGGGGQEAHVEILGWPYIFSAADVGLTTILGFVCAVEGARNNLNDWPVPRVYRAGTVTWNAPHTQYGGWNDGIGGNAAVPPAAAAGDAYNLVVPAGGLGVMLLIDEEHDAEGWTFWFNDADEADSPCINLLAWGLLT